MALAQQENKLVWNVFIENVNKREITTFNVFDHYGFLKSLYKLKKEENFEVFSEKVKNELRYYYWSKCEWEIVIKPWVGHNEEGKKIDVYDQIMMNWDNFINYLWNNQHLIKKVK